MTEGGIMMKTLFVRLIALLREETEAYRALLLCIQKEKRAVIDTDLAGLGEIGKQKERHLETLRSFDEQRHLALQALAEGMLLPVGELTLQRLSENAPPPYGEQLQRCACQLRDLMGSLQVENAGLKQLVAQGMELVRGSYNVIAHLCNASTVYRASGSLQPAAATGRFHHGEY